MKQISYAVATLAAMSFGSVASAAPLSVTFEHWGDLQDYFSNTVTYGGSGIPTGPGGITQIDVGANTTVTLGLNITPRFGSPAPTVVTDGTYSVLPGVSTGTASLWNFSFAAEITGTDGLTLDDLTLQLFYEMDPAFGTDGSDFGIIDLAAATVGGTFAQGSQNLSFGYLAGTPAFPFVTPPTYTGFDANALGQYGFGLVASTTFNDTFYDGAVGVSVEVAAATVPLPAGLPLLLAGLGGLWVVRRRKRDA